jgi:hypothetical protein
VNGVLEYWNDGVLGLIARLMLPLLSRRRPDLSQAVFLSFSVMLFSAKFSRRECPREHQK